MNIIDFHAHIYPDKIAAKAVHNIGSFYGLDMGGLGTAESLLQMGQDGGVSSFVVHSAAVTASQVEVVNNFIAVQCAEHPEFYGYGTMHIDHPDPLAELERMLSLGLRGVKLHPDMQRFAMDDPRMRDFYAALEEKQVPVLFHCGDYRYNWSHPARLCRVMDAFPKLIVIAAHFGGWSVYDLALEYLRDRSCYLDTSSAFSFTGTQRGKELIRTYGAERILFGSDFPMGIAAKERDIILSMGLTDWELELIFHKNAESILQM